MTDGRGAQSGLVTSTAKRALALRQVVLGYLIVVVFFASFVFLRCADASLSINQRLFLALILTAPPLVPIVAHWLKDMRVTGVQLGLTSLSISFESASANVSPLASAKIESAIAAQEGLTSSGNEELKIWATEFVRSFAEQQGVLLNLEPVGGLIPYWWSTRLYLVAGILADFTAVHTMFLVDGGKRHRYIGAISISEFRHRLGLKWTDLPEIYRRCLRDSKSTDGMNDVENLINTWGANWPNGHASESEMKERLGASELAEYLGAALDCQSIDRAESQGSDLAYKTLIWGRQLVPLTIGGQLDRVIDATKLAKDLSIKALERHLV